MLRQPALALALLALATGCGGSGPDSPEDVVRAWSEAVNAGDNDRAADLFAPGAIVVSGDQSVALSGHADARRFNASLPCAADIVEIRTDGDTVTATFSLRQRHELRICTVLPDPKEVAVVTVRDGKIVVWELVGASPEDGGGG